MTGWLLKGKSCPGCPTLKGKEPVWFSQRSHFHSPAFFSDSLLALSAPPCAVAPLSHPSQCPFLPNLWHSVKSRSESRPQSAGKRRGHNSRLSFPPCHYETKCVEGCTVFYVPHISCHPSSPLHFCLTFILHLSRSHSTRMHKNEKHTQIHTKDKIHTYKITSKIQILVFKTCTY